jgi:uncharacterized protein
MKEIIVAFISGLLIVLGGVGSFLPVLPGPPLSFGGLLLYAWYTGFDKISPTVLLIFGLLTLATMVLDFVAPALGAKGYKASKYGTIGSFIGAFAGMFVLGPIGIILGPFIGGFVGELMYLSNIDQAYKTAWGSFIGFLIGSAFRLGVILSMLAYFVYAVFK